MHSQFGTISNPGPNRTFSFWLSYNNPASGWPYRFRARGPEDLRCSTKMLAICDVEDVYKNQGTLTLEAFIILEHLSFSLGLILRRLLVLRNLVVLQILNLSQLLTHSRRIPFLACLALFLRNKFFSILQFLGNLSVDFLGRAHSSIPILHRSLFYLFEPDLPIDSLVVAEIVGTRTPDWPHKEPYVNFSFPNVWPPRLPQLRIIFDETFFLVGWPIQLSAQGFWGYFLCLLTIAQRFGLDLSSLHDSDPKKEWKQWFLYLVLHKPLRLSTES